MPYIVKHIPTGKYIKRTDSHPINKFTGEFIKDWNNNLPLTEEIKKARIYNNKAAISSSMGIYKIISYSEYKNREGKLIKYPVRAEKAEVDSELFEILEFSMEIKC